MRSLGIVILSILFCFTLAAVPAAQAQTFSVIHSFTGGQDGANPEAALTVDAAGNLYGNTYAGNLASGRDCGTQGGCGIVFKMTQRNSAWVLAPLYTFQGYSDGAGPLTPVIFGPDGLLYGAASGGGGNSGCFGGWFLGCGVIFKMQVPASTCHGVLCPWTETPIYQFIDYNDGYVPDGNIVFDHSGNLYGTTEAGGNVSRLCNAGCGTVFKLTRSGSNWEKSTIYSFAGGADGIFPESGLVMDPAGNLYGTASGGGAHNVGTVYELTPGQSGWTFNVIYTFQNTVDGAYPQGGMVIDSFGNLYGTTNTGGTGGGGTVFELSPSAGGWTFSVISSLVGLEGFGPIGSLAIDRNGNLYGATYRNGDFPGCGSVFKLTASRGWDYTNLHSFTCGDDGGFVIGGVALDASGNLYGTTIAYGPTRNQICGIEQSPMGCGVVWKITP